MIRAVVSILLICLIGCIEPIDINLGAEEPRLVVEGLISNVSFEDRIKLPQQARPFYIRLGYTREAGNDRNPVISDAIITLHNNFGQSWEYAWSDTYQQYFLLDTNFAAQPDQEYFIEIELSNGKKYISEPERMIESTEIGQVMWETDSRLIADETVSETILIEQRGIQVSVDVPARTDLQEYYYWWDVTPSWVFIARLLPEEHPNKTCYVTNDFYFDKINIEFDRRGGYTKDLFFLRTDTNHRILWDFTALVKQYSLTPEAYRFWEEISIQQSSGGGIFDPPPFRLSTNVHNVDDPSENVSGYFMVAHESSERWWFSEEDLPYDADIDRGCALPPGNSPSRPITECEDCLRYDGGASSITTIEPEWWRPE